MKEFKVTKRYVAFPVGTILGLNERQAGKRAHLLKKVDNGLYRIHTRPTGFKLGEIIRLDVVASKIKADNPLKLKAMGLEAHGWTPKGSEVAEDTHQDAETVDDGLEAGTVEAEAGEDSQEPQNTENTEAAPDLDSMLAKMGKKKLQAALKNRTIKFKKDAKPQELRATLKKAIEKEAADKAE